MAPLIKTSPVANRYAGVFRALFVNLSVLPAATVREVQLKMPSGGNAMVVSSVMFHAPSAPVLPQSNGVAAKALRPSRTCSATSEINLVVFTVCFLS
jgi:hypothetical protein